MSKKILNIASFGLLGKSSSKKAETPTAAPAAEAKGPKIRQLGTAMGTATKPDPRKLPGRGLLGGSILSDKLGS